MDPATKLLSIHGSLDRSVYYSEKKFIEQGLPKLQKLVTPNEAYSHMWYDSFSTAFWDSAISAFLDDKPAPPIIPKLAGKL